MVKAMIIKPATSEHLPAITAIYAHHVLHGTASFETEPPSEDDFAARLGKVRQNGWPWLVALDDSGAVLGYAYASQFRDRPAYRFACENSVYVRHDQRGKGIGRAMLAALIPAAELAGFRQMIAVIGGGEPASIAVHAAAGFDHAGRMRSVGRKHGHWLDTVYMQIALGEGDGSMPEEE